MRFFSSHHYTLTVVCWQCISITSTHSVKLSLYAQYIPFLNTFSKDDVTETFFRKLGQIVSAVAEESWEIANEKNIKDSEVVARIFATKLQQVLSTSFSKQ